MSNIQKSMDLLAKAHRVLDSCQTYEQYRTAKKWLNLAHKVSWAERVFFDIWHLRAAADIQADMIAMGLGWAIGRRWKELEE